MGRTRAELRRALSATLRDVTFQLSRLNSAVGTQVAMSSDALACLDHLDRQGSMTPSALAEQARIHPATMTGILDRLERDGWIRRERDPVDRRRWVVKALPERAEELLRLYAGMNRSLNQLYSDFTDEELDLVLRFLTGIAQAGRTSLSSLGPRS